MWIRGPVRGYHSLFKGSRACLSTPVREYHLHLTITILGPTKTLTRLQRAGNSQESCWGWRMLTVFRDLIPSCCSECDHLSSSLGKVGGSRSMYPARIEPTSQDSTCNTCTVFPLFCLAMYPRLVSNSTVAKTGLELPFFLPWSFGVLGFQSSHTGMHFNKFPWDLCAN